MTSQINGEFFRCGPNKWRDCKKPSVILEDLCAKNHLAPPMFPDNATVVVNGVEYRDNDSSGKDNKKPIHIVWVKNDFLSSLVHAHIHKLTHVMPFKTC